MHRQDTATAELHRISVERGQSLALDWYPAAAGARAALFVQGLGSHRRGEKASYFAQRFHALGWAYGAVDLRGHGDSDGALEDLTMSRMLADLDVTLTRLKRLGAAAPPVLIGSSMGCAVLAWHAAQGSVAESPLVMLAPALDFPAGIAAEIGSAAVLEWERMGARRWRSPWIDVEIGFGLMQDALAFDPDLLRQRFCSPTLIIHGMKDEVVHWRRSLEFLEKCPYPGIDFLALAAGDHRLTAHKSFVFDVMRAWLEQQR